MFEARAETDGDPLPALLESYAVNERMNQIVLEHLNPAAWRAVPQGSKVRTIAAIVTHVHNVRRKWLRLSAPNLKLPSMLNRACCTQQQARTALEESAVRCSEMLAKVLVGEIECFRRDGWAKAWPAGPAMVAYMISHEAHHRGQVCLLAHQLGYALPVNAASGMWAWERLWKESGFSQPRSCDVAEEQG